MYWALLYIHCQLHQYHFLCPDSLCGFQSPWLQTQPLSYCWDSASSVHHWMFVVLCWLSGHTGLLSSEALKQLFKEAALLGGLTSDRVQDNNVCTYLLDIFFLCQTIFLYLAHLWIWNVCLTHGHLLWSEVAPVCVQCGVSLTILHILWECPHYDMLRNILGSYSWLRVRQIYVLGYVLFSCLSHFIFFLVSWSDWPHYSLFLTQWCSSVYSLAQMSRLFYMRLEVETSLNIILNKSRMMSKVQKISNYIVHILVRSLYSSTSV
jgi:hypothetical protein